MIKLLKLSCLFLLLLCNFVYSQGQLVPVETTTSSTSLWPTTIFATGTFNGIPTTYLSTYTQVFYTKWTNFATPTSGSIGLGSINGTVGTLRVYSSTTVDT